MKLAAIMLFTIFLSGFASAQTTDSTATVLQRGNGKQHRLDRFIDLDGDGICDHRSQGLGFRRNRKSEAMKNSSNGTTAQMQSIVKGKQYRGGKK
jgi:hypothetical protein